MGWTYTRKPRNLKAFIAEELNWSAEGISCECLDTAIVYMTTAYSAVLRRGDPELGGDLVTCYVTLLDFYQKGQVGFKILSETVGPVKDNCPHKIYDLLTPLPEPTGDDRLFSHARDWRARVERNFELDRQFKLKLKVGNVLVPADGVPIHFPKHGYFDRFTVVKRAGQTCLLARGDHIRPSRRLVDRLTIAATAGPGAKS